LDAAIEFDATDGMKCDVFVVVLSSPVERHTHLVLQRQLSGFVREAELISKLRACHSQAEVIEVFQNISEESGLN
jgi:mannitol/fructose-specific phosphotransferase system IIA component (Ntr-type)